MTPRELNQEIEKKTLAEYACRNIQSSGRRVKEDPCPIRTMFQQDRDRIVFSNSFRRLKHKTQVFLSPLGDHYRTRLTHTLEVSEVARTIARALNLNEDLTEAIALGHDLGHTPFGHGGEIILKEIYSKHFSHSAQSLRVVDKLERGGRGLNLTYEVRDGILKHSKGFGNIIPRDPGEAAKTIEGRLVRISDIIAYLNHDLDDAIRSGVITEKQVPAEFKTILGKTHSERARTMIKDVIFSSGEGSDGFRLEIGSSVYKTMVNLRAFLYENVYRSPQVHREFVKAKKILCELYEYFYENEDKLEQELLKLELPPYLPQSIKKERAVCDLIASMTDRYAINSYNKIFMPSPLV
ncbi:MAG: deoxyguanosinetriphosphate triphosphohydrolase [Deltaproteobacteria bacterium]|nr:MAG: deoxyguanosinetriphosphate triphosphohydrolase [Deltaproteobacteria bacterium]